MIDEGLRIYEYITDGEAIAIVGQECDGDRVLKRNMWLVENGQQRLIKKAGIEGGCGWPKMGSRLLPGLPVEKLTPMTEKRII